MRSILTVWLITLLSLTNLSAVGQPMHLMPELTTITLQQYWDLVEETRQTVIGLESQPEAEIRQELDALAVRWDEIGAVELEDKSIITFHSDHLSAALRRSPADLKRLQHLLDVLQQAHQKFPGQLFTAEDVEPLQEILARPEFQWDRGQAAQRPEWLSRIFDAIADFTDRVVFALIDLLYRGRILFAIAAALLVAYALFYLSRNLSRSLVRDAELGGGENESEGLLTSKGALQRAQNLSMHGDYRNAIRYLYLSSLLVLDEQGLLRYDRSRTNREYLRSVASRPELAAPLHDVIDVFDRVWYGFEDVDEETYKSYVEHVDELREKKE